MFLKKILHYLDPRSLFRKGDKNVNLRMMHGINRISLFMFLICIIVLIVRAVTRG